MDYEEHADEAASLEEPSALASADNGFHEEDASEHAHGKRPFAEPDDDEQDEACACTACFPLRAMLTPALTLQHQNAPRSTEHQQPPSYTIPVSSTHRASHCADHAEA